MAQCALFVALITLGAFIKIPVPYFDYFTLQFLFVLLSGMLLGPAFGTLAVTIYLIMGLTGLPVFAAGGGIGYVLRPSFGFLLAFILTSFSVGFFCQRQGEKNFRRYLTAALLGFFITYTVGLGYKYLILNYYTGDAVPMWLVFLSAFPLDIPGDLLLCFLAALTAARLEKVNVNHG